MRGQTLLEYISIYGLTILVIIVALIFAWRAGWLQLPGVAPEGSSGAWGLRPILFAYTEEGNLSLLLKNELEQDVHIINITAIQAGATHVYVVNQPLVAGDTSTLNLTGLMDLPVGSPYKVLLIITYNLTELNQTLRSSVLLWGSVTREATIPEPPPPFEIPPSPTPPPPWFEAVLDCTYVYDSKGCPAGWTGILSMEDWTDAHAEKYYHSEGKGKWKHHICCRADGGKVKLEMTFVEGNCPSGYSTVIELSDITDAHVAPPDAEVHYKYKVCLSSGIGSLQCKAFGECPTGRECVVRIARAAKDKGDKKVETGFHVGNCTAFEGAKKGVVVKEICCWIS